MDVEKRLATRSPDLAVAQILNMLIISYNAMNDLSNLPIRLLELL